MSATAPQEHKSLFRTLAADVDSALQRLASADSEGHRRETVRTIFAAIEGMAWLYRDHVRSVAKSVGTLPSITDLALQEKTYAIDDTGHLAEQVRFVPLTSMIRFTTRLAQETFCDFGADFSGLGWSQFKNALAMRNRLMHPKNPADLIIGPSDVEIAKVSFFWFCDLATRGKAAANVAQAQFNTFARDFTEKLKSGDEETLAAYREALNADED